MRSGFVGTHSVNPPSDLFRTLVDEHFFLRYAAQRQQEILKDSALRSVLRYLDLWKQDFSLSLKTEHSFEMDVENALISGSIDLIKRKDGNGNAL